MLEETGLRVEVGPVVDVFDRILLDTERRVRYHYVLIDYLCTVVDGQLDPQSDAEDALWVARTELPLFNLPPATTAVIDKAFEMARSLP